MVPMRLARSTMVLVLLCIVGDRLYELLADTGQRAVATGTFRATFGSIVSSVTLTQPLTPRGLLMRYQRPSALFSSSATRSQSTSSRSRSKQCGWPQHGEARREHLTTAQSSGWGRWADQEGSAAFNRGAWLRHSRR